MGQFFYVEDFVVDGFLKKTTEMYVPVTPPLRRLSSSRKITYAVDSTDVSPLSFVPVISSTDLQVTLHKECSPPRFFSYLPSSK